MPRLRKINGNYYSYWYDRTRSPKEKSWPLRCTRQDVARKRLAELEQAFRDDAFDPWAGGYQREHVRLTEAIARFLSEKEGSVRASTLKKYRSKLEHWARDYTPSGLMCRDVQPEHVRAYVRGTTKKGKAIANATQRSRFRHVRAFLNWAGEQGLIDGDPLADVQQPKKQKQEPAYLMPEQVERLLRAIPAHAERLQDQPGPNPDDEWLAAMIRVGVCTGLRRSELINLRWNDVDLENGFCAVRNRADGSFTAKSGHERTVPLRGDGLERLRAMNEVRTDDLDGPVFTDKNEHPIKPDRVSKRFKFYVREAKLKNRERLHFHSLRHTTGSWLAMQGVPMPVISKIMGHSSTQVTEVYASVSDGVTVRAMEEVFGNG